MNEAGDRRFRVLLAGGPQRAALRLHDDSWFEVLAADADDCTIAALVGMHRPDIVVYDFPVTPRGIPSLAGILRLFGDELRAIALTECDEWDMAQLFLRSGGWGYVVKSCPEGEILDAIRSVARGIPFLCPHLAALHAKRELIHNTITSEMLTPVQREVMGSIKEGFSAKEIAAQRHVSVRTVESHIEKIRKKFGVHSVRELRVKPSKV